MLLKCPYCVPFSTATAHSKCNSFTFRMVFLEYVGISFHATSCKVLGSYMTSLMRLRCMSQLSIRVSKREEEKVRQA